MKTKQFDSMLRLAWFSNKKYPLLDAMDAHIRLFALPYHVTYCWEKPSKF